MPDLQCQSISARSKPDRHSSRLDRRQRNRSWLIKRTVSFVGPNNVVETIDVAGDAMIKAVTKLKPDDKADIAYTPGCRAQPRSNLTTDILA